MARLASAAVVALLLVLGGTAPARALELGVSDDSVARGLIGPQRHAAAVAGLGAGLHRLTFNWRFAEPSPGDYRLGLYDAVYAADLSRGVRPVFVVLFAPDWTWDPGHPCSRDRTCPYPPARAQLGAWSRLVAMLVRRYPQMAGLEVWNEPNLTAFWAPGPDPARYAELVRVAHDAVRGTGSRVPLLAGSLSDAPFTSGAAGMDAAPFLAAMLQHGALGTYDGLSVHPYPRGADLAPTFRTLSLVDRVRRAFGDVTPLWITEIGATTTQLPEAGQAAALVRLLRILASRPEVRAAFIHTLVAPPGNPGDPETGYGLLRTDLRPKPAYCAVAELRLRLVGGCPAPSPLTAPDPRQEARWDAQASVASAVDAALEYAGGHGGSLEGFNASPRVTVIRPPRLPRTTLLCAASRADLSYCAALTGPAVAYGHADGPIAAAAAATLAGTDPGW